MSEVGLEGAGFGEDGQAPGVEVAPIGEAFLAERGGGHPLEVQAGAQDGEGVGERWELVQAVFVLDNQQVGAGELC